MILFLVKNANSCVFDICTNLLVERIQYVYSFWQDHTESLNCHLWARQEHLATAAPMNDRRLNKRQPNLTSNYLLLAKKKIVSLFTNCFAVV